MRVLVVEDNSEMGPYLKQGLTEHGFAVDLVADGVHALDYAATGVYDLLILDRMLPGRDGLDILRRLRAAAVRTPAIFLTAKSAVSDRVEGLDSGADDYLVKPFSFAELVARIRVVLRRGPEIQPSVLRVADLSLDPTTHTVERGGQRVEVSAKQFALLHYLMRHAGQVVSRTMIQEHIWNYEFDGLDQRRGRAYQPAEEQGGPGVSAAAHPYATWSGLCSPRRLSRWDCGPSSRSGQASSLPRRSRPDLHGSMFGLRRVLDARNDAFLEHKAAELLASVTDDHPGDTSDLEAEIRREVLAYEPEGLIVVVREAGRVSVAPRTVAAQRLADRAVPPGMPRTIGQADAVGRYRVLVHSVPKRRPFARNRDFARGDGGNTCRVRPVRCRWCRRLPDRGRCGGPVPLAAGPPAGGREHPRGPAA